MATGATGTDSVARSPLSRRETILEPPFSFQIWEFRFYDKLQRAS